MNKDQIIVAIEGIDGAGKTTLIDLLCHVLVKRLQYINERTNKGRLIDKLVSDKIMQNHYMLQILYI